MKEYTVEKVVKLEERKNNFIQKYDERKDEELIMPALLCFAIGGSALTTALSGEVLIDSNLPLIISSAITALSATKVVNILSNLNKSTRMYNRLEKIYETMGPEFKKEVMAQLENHSVKK